MIKSTKRFLIVDDDPQNNFLSRLVLKRSLGEVEVTEFIIPEKGLEYIQTTDLDKSDDAKTTLLLDINMPTMTGWEFLEKFKLFADATRRHYNIFILSSSVDTSDIERAKLDPIVADYIEKPLNKAKVIEMFG